MKIGMRGGHSPKCKGARGIVDEQECVRKLSYELKKVLEKYGHTVVDCNSNASTVNGELAEGVNKANNNNVDIYIPLHMNAFNGSAHGCEVWTYDRYSKKAVEIGYRVCQNMESIGIKSRGIKHSKSLYDLRATKMQACLIELIFCDNKHDVDIWNKYSYEQFAYLLANAIDPNIPKNKPQPKPQPQPSGKTFYRVVCGSYENKEEAAKQQDRLKKAGFDSFLAAYKK